MLMIPALARPNSALYPLRLIWNSLTASWLIVGRTLLLVESLLSTPSIRTLFARPVWPGNERPEVATPGDCTLVITGFSSTTPGVSLAKSRKLRPLIGRLLIGFCVMVE